MNFVCNNCVRWVQSSLTNYCILFNVLFHCLFQLNGFWVVTVLLKLSLQFYVVYICCNHSMGLTFVSLQFFCVVKTSHCNFVLLNTCPTAILCAENLPHCNFLCWKLNSLQFRVVKTCLIAICVVKTCLVSIFLCRRYILSSSRYAH